MISWVWIQTVYFLWSKRCLKWGFSSKNIILKIKKKISKLFKLFRTPISTGNYENQKYVGNETPAIITLIFRVPSDFQTNDGCKRAYLVSLSLSFSPFLSSFNRIFLSVCPKLYTIHASGEWLLSHFTIYMKNLVLLSSSVILSFFLFLFFSVSMTCEFVCYLSELLDEAFITYSTGTLQGPWLRHALIWASKRSA